MPLEMYCRLYTLLTGCSVIEASLLVDVIIFYSNTSRWKMRIKSVTQWSGRVKSGGLDVMTVRGLGQEPAAITISSKGYTILTYVTCSVHFWTYICHQNSFHSNSFSSRVMRMSWVSQYFPCYTMLCWHTFTFVLRILLWVHSSIAYI